MDSQLTQSRTASVLMLLTGIWVAISPIWITVIGGAHVTVIIAGIVIALCGAVQYFWKFSLPSWIAAAAAVWLFIAAFGYGVGTAATWNQVIFAVLTVIWAYWDGMEITQVAHRQGSHAHQAM